MVLHVSLLYRPSKSYSLDTTYQNSKQTSQDEIQADAAAVDGDHQHQVCDDGEDGDHGPEFSPRASEIDCCSAPFLDQAIVLLGATAVWRRVGRG